jgi:hypothetical protein
MGAPSNELAVQMVMGSPGMTGRMAKAASVIA